MINDENIGINKLSGKSAAVGGKAKSGKGKTIEETYTKKTQLEHILLRPDTYIGAIDKQTQPMWVLDAETRTIVNRQCSYVPGLYKIFDEIIVNAADNKQRDPSMNRIEVTINSEEGFIRVWNNGNGIPVAIHQEHGIYVPELIFGNLLTGSNFDDNEKKTTGGRNGFGAKLANIFSTRFIVETTDSSRGLKYRQEFTNNMTERHEPKLQKASSQDCTCVTFYPDLARFKMDCLDEDIVSLLSKRVYDIAATNSASGAKLHVFLNGARIETKNFEQYVGLYQGIEAPAAFERLNEHWEIGVGVSDGSFQQVSFVNSICTTKGGCHVNYIADQITARLMPIIKRKNKGEEVKANQIKNHLSVFVNALIVNPAFDSQTKENLTTKQSAFGSTCTISDKMIKQVEKSGIIDNILNWAKFKQTAELKKKSGSKRSKLLGITKLDDANFAGTAKSSSCTLILTEGDSAKALAISGLGVVGRDYYGVFPLKGKLLNVREASHQQMMKNEEIQNISKIMGLAFGKVYNDVSSLRYGHILIMTDQDHDGSHIKGLLINFIHHFWPSLLQIPGFLQQFITPIVKCTRNKKEMIFYTIPEYQQWREQQLEHFGSGGSGSGGSNGLKGWKIKYYKGLGTSTAAEAKEYFSDLSTHLIDFAWDDRAADMIDMAFAKKRVEDRKLWLLSMEAGVHIDYTVDTISYDNFVNHELILFSHADNERSISHFMDGLKPSQRKVLYSCFKRNLRQEIKVAQLAGYVSEHSAYHHGEASLTQTIIGMAQNYVGSNNINLLSPCGQFGTRLMGGKDAASPRYVFSKLEAITRFIFHPHDDALLEYQDDDGQTIEPVHYVPVIPMALVNGADGIGTGWSSSVPNYNPREVIANLRRMIAGEEPEEMAPWYRGFTGEIEAKVGKDSNNFSVLGAIEQIDASTVVISELPVGKWTTDYKQFLESLVVGGNGGGGGGGAAAGGGDGAGAAGAPFIKDFKENHTDTSVLFTITCLPEKLAEFAAAPGGLVKKFKLEGSIATSNMNMFDLNSQIKKFESPISVLRDFFNVRMQYYDRRKASLADKLTEEWEKLDNKSRFVLAVINGELVVSNRKKADIMHDLQEQGFKTFYDKKPADKPEGEAEEDSSDNGEAPQTAGSRSLDKGYDYLLSMKIWSLTMEKVQDLINQRDVKRAELEVLLGKSAEDLWLEDLDSLEGALEEFEAAIDDSKKQELAARKKAQKAAAHLKGKGGKASKGRGNAAKAGKKAEKSRGYGSDSDGDDDDSEDDDDDDDDYDDSDFEEKPRSRKHTASSAARTVPRATTAPARSAPKAMVSAAKPTAKPAAKSAAKATSAAAQPSVSNWLNAGNSSAAPVAAPATAASAPTVDTGMALSLSERLRLMSSGAASAKTTAPAAVPAAKLTAKAPAAKGGKGTVAAQKNKNKTFDLCSDSEEDGEDDIFDDDAGFFSSTATVAPVASIRPARAAAKAKKSYAVADSEEEDDLEEDQEGDSVSDAGAGDALDDFEFHGSDDDDDDDDDSALGASKMKKTGGRGKAGVKKPTGGKAAAAPSRKYGAAVAKASAKVGSSSLKSAAGASVSMSAAAPQSPTSTTTSVVSKKRVTKCGGADSLLNLNQKRDVFSPGVPSPAAVNPPKKARAAASKKAPAAASKKAPVKSTTSAAARTAAKGGAGKGKAKKVITIDSDDEDESEFGGDEGEEVVVAVRRTPKPSRARKVLSYKEDEEDDIEDFIADSEEEEEDVESDYDEDSDY